MMGGLAYMTGLPDRPLRAGSSVVDIMGGTFAAVGILAALRERETSGRGKRVTSALFESTAYLVAQHMAQYELTGEAPPPMSVKRPAWGVYDIFDTADGRLFVGVVTDTQWQVFCREFGEEALRDDARLKTNALRVKERGWLIPRLGEILKGYPTAELARKLEHIGLPFAPIAKPWDLLEDPHLKASGGLLPTVVRGNTIHVPALPLELDGKRLAKRTDPPAVGGNSRELLLQLGYTETQVEKLAQDAVIALP
jgi:crotonobetainyl-CoA:carnitine CoA-transferase CaiB-like acyl-CoA transferase